MGEKGNPTCMTIFMFLAAIAFFSAAVGLHEWGESEVGPLVGEGWKANITTTYELERMRLEIKNTTSQFVDGKNYTTVYTSENWINYEDCGADWCLDIRDNLQQARVGSIVALCCNLLLILGVLSICTEARIHSLRCVIPTFVFPGVISTIVSVIMIGKALTAVPVSNPLPPVYTDMTAPIDGPYATNIPICLYCGIVCSIIYMISFCGIAPRFYCSRVCCNEPDPSNSSSSYQKMNSKSKPSHHAQQMQVQGNSPNSPTSNPGPSRATTLPPAAKSKYVIDLDYYDEQDNQEKILRIVNRPRKEIAPWVKSYCEENGLPILEYPNPPESVDTPAETGPSFSAYVLGGHNV